MSLPDILQTHLDDESVAARVDLGGEDELFVTPTRTLIYRAEGLLSDESVEAYNHDAERVLVSEGRRKSKLTLDYGLDGEKSFSLPTKRLPDALHSVLAGVLNAAGITGPGETVKQTYQFSELTLVITSARVVKHIGSAVWDGDYEEFHYDDVTDLTFEEGSVATSIVITTGGRQERFKAPNEEARAVREGLTNALLAHYDVESLADFRATVTPRDAGDDSERDPVDFGVGPAPLSANPGELSEVPANATRTDSAPRSTDPTSRSESPEVAADSLAQSLDQPPETETSTDPVGEGAGGTDSVTGGETDGETDSETGGGGVTESTADTNAFEGSGFESAVEDDRVSTELAALADAVEQQNEELRKQRETITRLIEELRQDR